MTYRVPRVLDTAWHTSDKRRGSRDRQTDRQTWRPRYISLMTYRDPRVPDTAQHTSDKRHGSRSRGRRRSVVRPVLARPADTTQHDDIAPSLLPTPIHTCIKR